MKIFSFSKDIHKCTTFSNLSFGYEYKIQYNTWLKMKINFCNEKNIKKINEWINLFFITSTIMMMMNKQVGGIFFFYMITNLPSHLVYQWRWTDLILAVSNELKFFKQNLKKINKRKTKNKKQNFLLYWW